MTQGSLKAQNTLGTKKVSKPLQKPKVKRRDGVRKPKKTLSSKDEVQKQLTKVINRNIETEMIQKSETAKRGSLRVIQNASKNNDPAKQYRREFVRHAKKQGKLTK